MPPTGGSPSSWAPSGRAPPIRELPVAVDSAIVFAPAGELVPRALQAVDKGGTVALAGIHMTDVPSHEL